MTGREKEVGEAWDALDVPGKKALMDGGAEAIKFSAADNAKVRQIGEPGLRREDQGARGQGAPGARGLQADAQPRREALEDLQELLELGSETRLRL